MHLDLARAYAMSHALRTPFFTPDPGAPRNGGGAAGMLAAAAEVHRQGKP